MRILYDHQVFSLQNAGGASRYFYELAKYMSGVEDLRTDVLIGINATVYPFQQLESSRTHVASLPGWLKPGSVRYAANEVWGNLKAATLAEFDVYHPTTYLRMPMVRTKRAVATHHDCTHERFPELFPDVKKVLWARRWLFPRVDAIICVSESCRQDLVAFLQCRSRQDFCDPPWVERVAAQFGGGCRTLSDSSTGVHPVCGDAGCFQEFSWPAARHAR